MKDLTIMLLRTVYESRYLKHLGFLDSLSLIKEPFNVHCILKIPLILLKRKGISLESNEEPHWIVSNVLFIKSRNPERMEFIEEFLTKYNNLDNKYKKESYIFHLSNFLNITYRIRKRKNNYSIDIFALSEEASVNIRLRFDTINNVIFSDNDMCIEEYNKFNIEKYSTSFTDRTFVVKKVNDFRKFNTFEDLLISLANKYDKVSREIVFDIIKELKINNVI